MKKISYILCMLLTSVMFAACTSDDLVENDGVKMGHDEKGNYIYVTVSAGVPATPQSRGIGGQYFMDYTWKEVAKPKIIVLLDGHRSELTLVPNSISNDMKSAQFEGRLYYGNVVPTETTQLRAYIETYFTKINNDGTYEMTNPTEMNYGRVEKFDVVNNNIVNFRHFSDHGVFYAETNYSSTNLTFNFSPKTAVLYFHIKYLNYYATSAASTNKLKAITKLSAKGLFGSSQTVVPGEWVMGVHEGGAGSIECACIVDTRYPVSDMKLSLTYSDGQNVERRIALAKSTNRLEPGKIYQRDLDMTPQVGDYLYSSGGWGDLLPNEMIDNKDVVGIVFGPGTSEGLSESETTHYGLAVALEDAQHSNPSYFTTTAQPVSSAAINNNIDPATTIMGTYSCFGSAGSDKTGLSMSTYIKSYNAANIAHNFSTTNYSEWYLPNATEMNLLAQNMYGATPTITSDYEITFSSFNRSKLKTQIDRLAGTTTFNDLNGSYWTSTFHPSSTSTNVIGWVADFNQAKDGNNLGIINITQQRYPALIRPVTRVGYFKIID